MSSLATPKQPPQAVAHLRRKRAVRRARAASHSGDDRVMMAQYCSLPMAGCCCEPEGYRYRVRPAARPDRQGAGGDSQQAAAGGGLGLAIGGSARGDEIQLKRCKRLGRQGGQHAKTGAPQFPRYAERPEQETAGRR